MIPVDLGKGSWLIKHQKGLLSGKFRCAMKLSALESKIEVDDALSKSEIHLPVRKLMTPSLPESLEMTQT